MKVIKKSAIVTKAKTTEHTITERHVLESVRRFPFIVTMHYAFQTEAKLHLIMGIQKTYNWFKFHDNDCFFYFCYEILHLNHSRVKDILHLLYLLNAKNI